MTTNDFDKNIDIIVNAFCKEMYDCDTKEEVNKKFKVGNESPVYDEIMWLESALKVYNKFILNKLTLEKQKWIYIMRMNVANTQKNSALNVLNSIKDPIECQLKNVTTYYPNGAILVEHIKKQILSIEEKNKKTIEQIQNEIDNFKQKEEFNDKNLRKTFQIPASGEHGQQLSFF